MAELIAAGRADDAAEAMHAHVVMSRDVYLQTEQAGSTDTGTPDAAPGVSLPPPRTP